MREKELTDCLRTNLSGSIFDTVGLFLERLDFSPILHGQLQLRSIDHRPSYFDYLQWAGETRPSHDDLTVIANSDIFFDGSLVALADELHLQRCAVLSRWNLSEAAVPTLFDRNDSQDAWVFKGPLRNVQADFPVGVPRCDNRFLYELKRAGYEVINPAYSVRAYHLHAGQRSEYKNENLEQFVEPPYVYLWPHNLWSLPRTLLYNLQHPEARIDWRLDRRQLECSLPVRASRKLLRWLRPATESVD